MAPFDLEKLAEYLRAIPCALCGEPVTQLVVTPEVDVLFVCSGHPSEPAP